MPTTATNIHAREISYDVPPDIPPRFLLGETPIFTAYGCALLERKTTKSHVYSAVNLTSGKKEILFRKHRPLDEREYLDAAAKIKTLPIAGAGRFSIDRPPRKKLPRKKMDEVLSNIFADILPQHGYAMREKQIALTEHILETISRRAISLAESEVGTGKTMAYLVAAVLAKRGRLNDFWLCGHYPQQSYAETAYMPVVITTSSIALQRAIIRDYLPELSNILMLHGIINTPLTCVIRKGREHFLCERRLHAFFKDADVETQGILRPLVSPNAPCDLADAEGLTPFMKRKICVSGKCGESCRHAESCRYLRYMQQANDPEVDFLICNHNYYLADVLHRASGKRPLLPHYQLVVIDESHKFLDAARQMYGVTLDESELPRLAATIHSFTEDKYLSGVNIHRLAKKLEEQGKRLFGRLRNSLPSAEDDEAERFPANLDADATRHLKTIAGIATDIIAALADSLVHARHRDRRAQAVWELENLKCRTVALRKHSDLVCWLEQSEDGLTLASIPKNLDERLYTNIWSQELPLILTSGTLSAGGDFSRIKHSLGLSRMRETLIAETSQPSPFDYHRNVMLYISDTVPFPDQQNKEYLLSVADEVERLVLASHGHAAVLFTSYNAMGQVFSILRGRNLSFPMFRMGKRDTAALDNFKQSGNGILFASGSFWEGIDIPGDALSMLIIVKLPFAVPDPIGDYEKTLYPDMTAYKNQALVPDMLVKLKQGFGRLIRTEGDSGVCAILDFRAHNGAPYHDRVVAALPFCHTSSSINDVRQFMADRKPATYFK